MNPTSSCLAVLALAAQGALSLAGQPALTPVWTVQLPGHPVRHGAAAAPDGTLQVAMDGRFSPGIWSYISPAQLFALNPDGTTRWVHSGGNGAASPPSVGPDGTLYYGARQAADGYAHFHAVLPDGSLEWHLRWNLEIDGAAATTAAGIPVLRTHIGHIYQLESADEVRLVANVGGVGSATDAFGTPVVGADGTLYAGAGGPTLHAFDSTGELQWQFPAGDTIRGVAVAADGTVYAAVAIVPPFVGLPGGGLFYALNPDGSLRWQVQRETEFRAGPAIAPNGSVYLPATVIGGAAESGELLRFRPDGQLAGATPFAGALESTPAIDSQGFVWVTDPSGTLTRLSADGTPTGQYALAGLGSAPLITPGGQVVVTTVHRQVIAFEAAPPPPAGWPQAGRDPQRSHRDPTDGPPSPPTGLQASTDSHDAIQLSWIPAPTALDQATYEIWRGGSADFNAATRVAQFIQGDRFHDTNVTALVEYFYWVRARNGFGTGAAVGPVTGSRENPPPGGIQWRYEMKEFAWQGIAVGVDGTVFAAANRMHPFFLGTDNARLVALGRTAEIRWSHAFDGLLLGAPVLGIDGSVLVSSLEGSVGRLDAFAPDGTLLWSLDNPGGFRPPVIGSDGAIHLLGEQIGSPVAASGRNQFVLNPDGSRRWEFLNNDLASTPWAGATPMLTGDDRLWLGYVVGIELFRAGTERVWALDALGGYPVGLAPSADGGVYVVNRDGLRALRPDGSTRWFLASPDLTTGPVLGADQTLYVGSRTNALLALTPDGQTLWSAPLDGAVPVPAVVGADGGVFAGTAAGTVTAWNQDGSPRWQSNVGAAITTAPTLTPEGSLLFGTDTGTLWALRTDTPLGITPWPKHQRDPGNQGRADASPGVPDAPGALSATVLPSGATVIHLTWSSAFNAEEYEVRRAEGSDFNRATVVAVIAGAEPVFDDDLTRDGVVYGYWVRGMNAAGPGPWAGPVTGLQTNQLWALALQTLVRTPVVADDGTVFVVNSGSWLVDEDPRGEVAAVNPDGSRRWTYADPLILATAPALGPSGRLVIGTAGTEGPVVALDQSGQLVWRSHLAAFLTQDPVVDALGTTYFVRNAPGDLQAVSVDGVRLWSGVGANWRDHVVIASDGSICGSTSVSLIALRSDGSQRWAVSQAPYRFGVPSLDAMGNLVMRLTDRGGGLLARFGLEDGQPQGSVPVPPTISGVALEPAIGSDGRVFAVTSELIALDASDTIQWSREPEPGITFNRTTAVPALDQEGNVYVATTHDLRVYDRSGTEIVRIELGRPLVAPPVLTPDGRLYLAASGRLYAVRALAGLDTAAPWPMYRRDPQGTGSQQRTAAAPGAPVLHAEQLPFANKVRIAVQPGEAPVALELYRSARPDPATAVKVADGRTGELFVEDLTAPPGQAHYYWVRARNFGGLSDFVGPVSQAAVHVPVRWFRSLPDVAPAPPAVGPDGTIYPVVTNRLLALAPDGTERARFEGVGGRVVVGPDGAVVLRSAGRLQRFTAGLELDWSMEDAPPAQAGAPAVAPDGTILISLVGEELLALRSSGTVAWRRTIGYSAGAPGVARDGSIWLRQGDRNLLGLHPDGAVLGDLPMGYSLNVREAPSLDADGTLVLPSAGPLGVVATQPDGVDRWFLPSSAPVPSLPVIGREGRVYCGFSVRDDLHQAKPRLGAVDPDGVVRWWVALSTSATSPALLANGSLLVGVGPMLQAYDQARGELLWQFESPDGTAFSAPIVDEDGVAYLAVSGGVLALEVGSAPSAAPWPMVGQNVRQSNCAARGALPEVQVERDPWRLEIRAPAGAVIWQSEDLARWSRFGFQPPQSERVGWPITVENRHQFYRVQAP